MMTIVLLEGLEERFRFLGEHENGLRFRRNRIWKDPHYLETN